MRKKNAGVWLLPLLFLLALPIMIESAAADEPAEKVAVFVFDVMAKQDNAFMGQGMARMLCARIGTDDAIDVRCMKEVPSGLGITTDRFSANTLLDVPDLSGVRYLLMGSITIAGTAVSTDARLVDVTGEKKALYLHESGNGLETVMTHAARLAEKVRAAVTGRPFPKASETGIPGRAGKTGSAAGVLSLKPAETSERAREENLKTNAPAVSIRTGGGPAFVSQAIKAAVTGIALVDTAGDGRPDLAVIDDHRLMVLSWQNGRLVKKWEYESHHYYRHIGIDAFDVNQDGREELLVSVLGPANQVRSYVAGVAGGRLQVLFDDLPWYFRVSETGQGDPVLMGQKGGHEALFWGDIYQLEMAGQAFHGLKRVMSGTGGIFGRALFTGGPGPDLMTWFDDDGYLHLGDPTFKSRWKSEGSYGSTSLFAVSPGGKNGLDRRRYFNSRVAMTDLDGDGHPAIITCINEDLTRGFLSGFRKFTRGGLVMMEWENDGMYTRWESTPQQGYIADFTRGDLDGDGVAEIVSARVRVPDRIIGTPRSVIEVHQVAVVEK